MLAFLPKWLLGCIAVLLYAMNSAVWLTLIFVFALFKVIPLQPLRKQLSYFLDFYADAWTRGNTAIQDFTTATQWDAQGLAALQKDQWYMVIANHQCWVDILVIQRLLGGKAPFIKFFLKKELIWVPFFGLAWWALDFPFMVRYNKAQIRKQPHLKGKDVETTRKACEKFRYKPVSVMNFVEGTRFTEEKHASRQSPYKHLLKPKAGGTAFVLAAMQNSLHQMVNMTIFYPQGRPTFWQFISGQVGKVVVRAEVLPITQSWRGDYDNDTQYRKVIQGNINELWSRKDQLLEQLAQQQQVADRTLEAAEGQLN